MISLFLILYVLSEPFERLEGRWSGIASLSSIIWIEDFNLGETLNIDFYTIYCLSVCICMKKLPLTPFLATLFSFYTPYKAVDIMNFYIWYVFVLYQVFKIGESEFMLNF